MRASLLALLAGLVVVGASFLPRLLLHDRTPTPSGDSWTAADPDSLYHCRRVERVFVEGLPVAAEDPLLNAPHGARIPWPPYYELVAAALVAPFRPTEPAELHAYIERSVCRLPLLFGALTSLAVFLAARGLGGTAVGLLAGLLHAATLGSIVYSADGSGDHHAFVTLCTVVLAAGLSAALGRARQPNGRLPWTAGAALGVVAGLAIGSWVASLIAVVVVDLVFAWLLFVDARRPLPGLGSFGAALHLAALLVLLPAVLQSPWKEEQPWMVVNLSWFHLAFLGLGAAVFVPLLGRRSEAAWRAHYPWIVGATLIGLALLSVAVGAGPAAGIREGFAWVSRGDSFMGAVAESRPLIGPGAVSGELVAYLGWSILALPLAWLGALVVAARRGHLELLPWLFAALVFGMQAARQARFAEALAAPAAVLTAWALFALLRARLAPRPALALGLAAVLLVPAAHAETLRLILREDGPRPDWRRERASRELCEWIAARPREDGGAVLANWNRGHELEWVTKRPTVATNFGSYVGEEGFLAPARFFLAAEEAAAEAVLEAHEVRYVLLSCFLSNALPGWVLAGDAAWEGRYFEADEAGSGRLLPAWYGTTGGRLLDVGAESDPDARTSSPHYLRLVHVSPTRIHRSPLASRRGPSPYGWIWERVQGARVELRGSPGSPAAVEVELEYADPQAVPGDEPLERVLFRSHARIDEAGRAYLRVPYATLEANGDGQVRRAAWRVGERSGELRLLEEDVVEGRRVVIDG